jgi:predicted kinase
MAGQPASGKSRLARLLGREIGGIVIDLDIARSALIDDGIDREAAWRVAYNSMFLQAEDFLEQGHSVILDSPSFFEFIPATGIDLASRSGARYVMVECVCDDSELRAHRMKGRNARSSQMADPEDPAQSAQFAQMSRRTAVGPPTGWIRIDTSGDLDECVRLAARELER